MALTATFEADFSAFRTEVESVIPGLAEMQAEANRLSDTLADMGEGAAPEQLHEVAQATDEVSEANSRAAFSVEDFIKGYISATAILAAAEAAWTLLTDTITASITSALEAEETQAGLLATLEAQGTAMPSVITAYEQYASALQAATVFSDDAAVAAQRILARFGVMPRDMERALKATADLAQELGKTLPEAATMLGRAIDGNTTAFEKAHIEIKATAGETASFEDVLRSVEAAMGGAAEKAGNTLPGQLKKLENSWDNVKESMGRAITSNETVRTLLADVNSVLMTNTGELKNNAAVTNLVSDAVILLAKGFTLAIDGMDFFQKELTDVRKTADVVGRELNYFYLTLQAIELATQKPLAWAGSAEAKKRVEEANAAIERAKGNIEAFNADIKSADDSSQAWSAQLQGLKGNLEAYITQLEKTRGKTVEVTAAQNEANGVWNKGTGDITAATMALQEHKQALDLLEKNMWKIDTAATALARSREEGVVKATAAELKARADAEAAFWKMHAAEEAAMLKLGESTAQGKAGIDSMRESVAHFADEVVAMGTTVNASVMGITGGATGTMPIDIQKGLQQLGGGRTLTMDEIKAIAEGQSFVTRGLPPGAGLDWQRVQRSWDRRIANIILEQGAVTMNYPITSDPRAMDELGRHVGESILKKMTRTGARV
jgi:hypothetical protein